MAVSDESLHLLDGLTVHVARTLEATEQALLASWARAWNEVAREWEAAVADLVAASKDGAWPTTRQVRRARRAREARALTLAAVQSAAAQMRLTVSSALPAFTEDAVDWELRLLGSQLPGSTAKGVALLASLERVDERQLAAIVRRTMYAVTKDAAMLPSFVTSTIQSVLVKGVAVGDNPRTAAAEMMRRLRGSFDLGRARALVIARTEMLDAHRAAALEADRANRKVLAGWQWSATLDERTCIGCLSMHGRRFPIDQAGPEGHQQCRCARLPVTKTWADLGFDVEEPPDLLPDAQAWFDSLPPAVQRQIAGPARLAAYRDGLVAWEDLAVKRSNPGWRDSWVAAPVRTLIR